MVSIHWPAIQHFKESEFTPLKNIKPHPELVVRLNRARELAGIPFVITSGIRTPKSNRDAEGVENSAHLTGHAVDIRCGTSRERFLIVNALLDAGFTRIGIGEHIIHVDCDPSKPQRVIW